METIYTFLLFSFVFILGMLSMLAIIEIKKINKGEKNRSKNEETNIYDGKKLEVGDVIIETSISNNPFQDKQNQFETVISVKENESGDVYFLSYTSDIEGNKNPKQNVWSLEHCVGRLFLKNVWEIKNHVELKNI